MDIPENGTVLTRNGYDKIRRELEELIKVKRPAIVDRIREATALGDLSENFDYHDAKHQQGLLESRLADLKAILSCATVVDCANGNGCVGIGSVVKVKDVSDGYEDTYTIVGPPESNPSEGKISYESSVGAALVDRKVGEVVEVETPSGNFKYEIVAID
ncbi:MAG: transcription elongation factor GreA [Armatimonadota bacterium]